MTDNVLSASQKTVLELVRIAMGKRNEKEELSFDNVNWTEVYSIACSQGVAAITCDALNILYDQGRDTIHMPKDLRMLWIGVMMQHESLYECHKDVITDLLSLFSKHGIDTMVLKGYGLSLNYPKPNHRPCGDIDIWLRGKQKEADSILKKERGIDTHKSSHHTIFEIDGCEIENHITILEHDTHRSNIKIDKYLTELSLLGEERIELNGKSLLLPSDSMNSLFLLRHMSIHFCVDGITIRHLLDWATFVERHSVDWNALLQFAAQTNSLVFLNSINTICRDLLGYCEDLFPVNHQDNTVASRIIRDIFSPEFSDDIPSLDSNLVKYGVVKSKRLWHNRWKSKITNTDSFISQILCYSINRIKESVLHL